ncbi:hypothetical protein BpHYR1_049278 [Brachionus plicatilis]|uniref:Uncharacterized protein n=1 Tax=Brachionus plicatilis TaxID=10195 RepID=A0A3M7S0I8_BRAPC|nr:hypothetical protein BpHYR1_049278 [Brachionus plicatilis]
MRNFMTCDLQTTLLSKKKKIKISEIFNLTLEAPTSQNDSFFGVWPLKSKQKQKANIPHCAHIGSSNTVPADLNEMTNNALKPFENTTAYNLVPTHLPTNV